jgi:hypothetical protein
VTHYPALIIAIVHISPPRFFLFCQFGRLQLAMQCSDRSFEVTFEIHSASNRMLKGVSHKWSPVLLILDGALIDNFRRGPARLPSLLAEILLYVSFNRNPPKIWSFCEVNI